MKFWIFAVLLFSNVSFGFEEVYIGPCQNFLSPKLSVRVNTRIHNFLRPYNKVLPEYYNSVVSLFDFAKERGAIFPGLEWFDSDYEHQASAEGGIQVYNFSSLTAERRRIDFEMKPVRLGPSLAEGEFAVDRYFDPNSLGLLIMEKEGPEIVRGFFFDRSDVEAFGFTENAISIPKIGVMENHQILASIRIGRHKRVIVPVFPIR